jgi:uncharacterized Zn finger protein
VAEKRRKAEKAAAKMMKKGKKILPVNVQGRMISTTFWGQAWCRHLEAFSDFENRLPRGRSYVRNGSVIHLDIDTAKVEALVQGSSLYKVAVKVKELDRKKWSAIRGHCSGQIGSLIELLQGRLSSGVMQAMINQERGLFPKPKEMTFSCSCPDWANMCKHVAAVLYGVGHRLDQEPALLFKLRNVDHLELMDKVRVKPGAASGKAHIIKGRDLSKIFGVDIVDGRPKATPSRASKFRSKTRG